MCVCVWAYTHIYIYIIEVCPEWQQSMTLSPIQYIFYTHTPTHSPTNRHTFIDNWTLAEKCLCISLGLASLYIILHFYVFSHIYSTCNISRLTHTHTHSRPLNPKCISAAALFIVFYVMEYVISHKLHAPHSAMRHDAISPPARPHPRLAHWNCKLNAFNEGEG